MEKKASIPLVSPKNKYPTEKHTKNTRYCVNASKVAKTKIKYKDM